MSEDPMRAPIIAILVSDYFPSRGGTTTQARLHAIEFTRRGWDVTVLTRRVRNRLGSERIEGIKVRRISVPGHGRLAKAVDLTLSWIWLFRRRRTLDAVSVIMDADFALAACASGLGRSTVVTWVTRGDPTRMLSGRIGGVRLRLLRNCKQVALSPRMEEELRKLGVSDVSIIPVPVDTSRFRPPTTAEKEASVEKLKVDGKLIILFVGHLQERKGVDLLIRALRDVLDAKVDAHLVIVGGPVETVDNRFEESLRSIIRDNGLDDRVTFTGPQDDVTTYLFAADIFCLPSHREGMPNVLLEAMSCELTCVAPASAGGDELLFGSAGVIPKSNSPADLADALIELLTDPELRSTMGKAAGARARGGHRPERIVADYELLFSLSGSTSSGGKEGSASPAL